jgi:hypothetical protein
MGDSCATTSCKKGHNGEKPRALPEYFSSRQLLHGYRFISTDSIRNVRALPCRSALKGGSVMDRFILGLLLAMLLTMLVSAQGLAQGVANELNSSASSVQALPDEGSTASIALIEEADSLGAIEEADSQETIEEVDSQEAIEEADSQEAIEKADGQSAIDEAEEMDQLIQTISDSSSGSEEDAAVSGTADAQETDQSIPAPESDSVSAEGVDEGAGTIEDAEEVDQLIQVLVEDEGSTNEEAEADQYAEAAGKEEVTNQSLGIFSEDASEVSAEAGQASDALNQTQSMGQLIQTLVDSKGNNSSETVQNIKSINETVPAGQSAGQSTPIPADNGADGAETALQTGITENTESMNQQIQILVDNEKLASTNTAQVIETIGKTEPIEQPIEQLIQTLEDEGDTAKGSDVVVSAQDYEIIDEAVTMERLIQALASEGSDVQP